MDAPTRDLLGWFHRRALAAEALTRVVHDRGVVELELRDAVGPRWRIDLEQRRFGAHVAAPPTVRIRVGVAALSLHAADRIAWRELEADGRLEIVPMAAGASAPDAAARPAAEALLDAIRVV